MSTQDEYDDDSEDGYEDEILDQDELEDVEDDGDNEMVAAASGWGVSLALHALICLILMFVVVIGQVIEQSPPTRVAKIEPPPPPPEEPKEERTLKEVTTEIVAEVEVETPVVTNLDLEVEELETEDEIVTEVSEPKGREEAVATSETGGSGAFMAIGAGGGGAGAFGNRAGGGKKRALGRFGGSKASESAVDAALRWFMRHQSPNGQWDVDGYPVNCTLPGPKCEPGKAHTDADGDGDAACSGYALLCFLGAGYDHKTPNKYRAVVQKGLDYLVSIQDQDGGFGKKKRNYENGVCTMALAEAYAMTNDPKLREPAQRGVDKLLAEQNRKPGGEGGESSYGGLGWNYTGPSDRHDSSVTGWCVMALKSAKAGGLDTGNGMQGAKDWFKEAWELTNKHQPINDPYTDRSGFCYAYLSGKDSAHQNNRTAIGLCCGVFLGYGQGDLIMETMANDVLARALDENDANYQVANYPVNTYYMYYNTLGVFQVGGERWKRWNAVCRDMLVDSQRKDGDCFDGSWDYEGTRFHGHDVGRLLSTAYCCLSLEVYYRYMPIALGAK